ncbi:MAG TPA: HD domain-containing phosphohydrolase, partial [Gaiellaceae bacterium]|nr:HD domain-containing phosphohydrolase [Gaiellaceae bacterium]
MTTSVPTRARALVLCIVTLGGATTVGAVAATRDVRWGTLALLALAAILTELFQVEGDEGTGEPADTQQFSFSSGVHIAAMLMLGPWAAAMVAAMGVVVVDGLRRQAVVKVAYNASVFAIAALAGGGVYMLAGGSPGRFDLPSDFLPIGAAWATYTLVNQLLVSLVVAFHGGFRTRVLLREKLAKDLPSAAAEAGLGISLAAFALVEPWAIVALAPLVVAVYQALARHAEQRRETARALETFANVVDERDPHTFRHSERVAGLVLELAEGLELSVAETARLRWAARLHDLGKIAVDAEILRKPARLSPDEFALMQRHPRLSARILRRFRAAGSTARAVEYHHERYDGQGYYGVQADAIPLAAHFITLADSFDAMTSDRPYRAALADSYALEEIERLAGLQYHPGLARAFVAMRRGEDPLAALGPEDRRDLNDLWSGGASRPALMRYLDANRPETVVLAGVVVALWSLGAGAVAVAPVGAIAAILGVGWLALDSRRLRRLSASLGATLGAALPRALAFHATVGRLESETDIRWAGLVGWNAGNLATTLELERRTQSSGPESRVLTSWFLRDADDIDELHTIDGAELGVDGVYLAAPLAQEGMTRGFLIVGFAHGVPRHVEAALRARLGELAAALLPPSA